MGSPAPVPSQAQLANYSPAQGDAIIAYQQNTVRKQPARLASGATIANLSSVTVANFDGTAQGVTLVAGDRVLVKNNASLDGIEGTAAKRMGLYAVGTVTTGTAPLTRDIDANTSAMVTCGLTIDVMEGTFANQSFKLTTANPIVLDTTALSFAGGTTTAINGTSVPASPAAGQGLLATSTTTAIWTSQGNLSRSARNVVLVNVASLASYTVAGNDGVTNVAGDRVLLVAQTTATQNGLYAVGTVTTGTAPLTRVTDLPAGAIVTNGIPVEVSEGTAFAGTWRARSTTTGGAVVDTNDPVFYPNRYVRVTTAMAGTPGTKALSAEWIFSATTSSVIPVVKAPGTQGFLSLGALTAGPGTGALTITSTANETSTLEVEFRN
jgi:hypothetical protein